MDILKDHAALKIIGLSGNKLRDATLHRFCDILPHNTTMKRLSLESNVGITNAAAANLIVAIRDNPRSALERDDLGRTSVREATIDDLVKAFTKKHAVQKAAPVLAHDDQRQADIDFEEQLAALLDGGGGDSFLG